MNALTTIDKLKVGVRRDAEGRYNLTDLWKLAGRDENRKPALWQQTLEAKAFFKAVVRILNVSEDYILRTKRGRAGGTWASEQVFVEYAQYLDARLAVLVNQAFIERVEEEKNPELAVQRGNERATKVYEREGKDASWIASRIVSITTRKAFTFRLASAGVEHNGFRACTNAIYAPLYGGSSEVVRMKKGLSKQQNIRDNMSLVELGAVMLSESLAAEAVQSNNLHGNAACELACNHAARSVAKAIMASRVS